VGRALSLASLVRASLLRSRVRTAWALASLVLLASLCACLLGLEASIADRARAELSRYGPNVVLRSADPGVSAFPEAWIPSPAELAAHGAERATLLGSGPPGALLGSLDDAWLVAAAHPDGAGPMRVAVRVRPDEVGGFVDWIAASSAGLDASVVRRVAWTEARVLQRTRAFVLGTSLVLLVLCGLCFATTLLAQWMERRPEIGLMLALGATRAQVARLFAAEVAALAIAGGLAGGLLGSVLGWVVLREGFDWDAPLGAWPWWTVAAALGITAAVALAGGALPLRRALAISPLDSLRSDG
jgi:putative ABC transport system permease protein